MVSNPPNVASWSAGDQPPLPSFAVAAALGCGPLQPLSAGCCAPEHLLIFESDQQPTALSVIVSNLARLSMPQNGSAMQADKSALQMPVVLAGPLKTLAYDE